MPVRDEVTPLTAYALANNVELPGTLLLRVRGKPVERARNELAARALSLDPRPEFIVWVDSDAFWFIGTFTRLALYLKCCRPLDMIVPIFGGRWPWGNSFQLTAGFDADEMAYVKSLKISEDFSMWTPLTPIVFSGAHFMMHRTELLSAIGPNPWAMNRSHTSEDEALVQRVGGAGGRLYADRGTVVLHVRDDGLAFAPHLPALRIKDGKLTIAELPEIAGEGARNYGPAVDQARSRAPTLVGTRYLCACYSGKTWWRCHRYKTPCPCKSGRLWMRCCAKREKALAAAAFEATSTR